LPLYNPTLGGFQASVSSDSSLLKKDGSAAGRHSFK
jgi:hypothetical protein